MAVPPVATVSAIRDALAALARSFKRVSVYRHARDQHLAYLEPALAELRPLLDQKLSLTVAVEPTALVYEGEVVHSEPARETGFCFRLHRDGVRTLSFRRGVGLEELLALSYVAMADPQAEGGREDAVTELWKADLAHIAYSAGAGYRMDESAAETISGSLPEITARAQELLDSAVGESLVEAEQRPQLWTEEQRKKGDPEDYSGLARRAALTILLIVEQDHAGWDLESLQETFWRLVDQMLDREHLAALSLALDRLKRIGGSHAVKFRAAVGRWLAEPARIERAVKLVTGAERPPLLPSFLHLLPPEAGPAILPVLRLGRAPALRLQIAAAALARIDSCAAQLVELLRMGTADEVRALLASMAPLPAGRRAELATAAFENPDPAVKLDAIPLVAADPPAAVRSLGTALSSPVRPVRVAAAQALASCAGVAEQASTLLLAAMGRPQFGQVDKEEQTLFYRALGKLGANSGFSFLVDRLESKQKKFFKRRKAVEDQLLAVQGLVEEGSLRSLRALEDALLPQSGHPPAVVAACRAAAQHVRAASKGGRTA
jgi:hypothetical protein